MDERVIEELKVLRLQPGETLVIETQRVLTNQQRNALRDAIGHAGIKAVILDGDLKATAVQSC